tara:strand:+ start:277 stop:531 length:255 start_codon:yes stop_codon:yes gene_type:complete
MSAINNRLNITSIDRRFFETNTIIVRIIPHEHPEAWSVEMWSYKHDVGGTHISRNLFDAYSTALDVTTKAIATKLTSQESTHGS